MHFDYKNDAPLDFDCKTFMSREQLMRHRDTYMGNAAAQLAVYTDGDEIKNKSGADAALVLSRRPVSSMPRRKRRFAAAIRESAAEYYCHCMFFSSLCDAAAPKREEIEKIGRSYGSLENFRYLFCQKAAEEKRPGYLWLIGEKNNRLKLWFSVGHALPPAGCKVILCLDLWEHAYIGTYSSNRAAYAAAFLSVADFSRIL